ncbi:MAG: hypothetical protein VKK63_08700 [Synechococcus sp.]|nr:hypothetical protein [Synechococcus sp.]
MTAALDVEIAASGLQQGPAAYLWALVPRQFRSAWRKAYGYGKGFACGNIGQSPSRRIAGHLIGESAVTVLI